MQSNIANEILKNMAASARAHDFNAHMNLISKNVQVFGVPGFEVIGYDDWSSQCKHEFEEKLIKNISYEGLKLLTETPDKIMFKTVEIIETTGNNINSSGIEVIIEKEADGIWRVTQERILSDEELAHDRTRGL